MSYAEVTFNNPWSSRDMTTTDEAEEQLISQRFTRSVELAISALGLFTVEPGANAVQWQLVKLETGWSWRKLDADGAIESMSGRVFRDYDFACQSAQVHGFRPKEQHWTIETDLGTTHFYRGKAPAFVPRKNGG